MFLAIPVTLLTQRTTRLRSYLPGGTEEGTGSTLWWVAWDVSPKEFGAFGNSSVLNQKEKFLETGARGRGEGEIIWFINSTS